MDLDLSQSRIKVRRAFDQLEALQGEAPALGDKQPFNLRVTPIDQDSGWATIFISPLGMKQREEPLISNLMGELVHNLRCALDYIVTGLVHASGAQLTRRHQFPIYATRQEFRKAVLSEGRCARPHGPLRGVTVGLAEVEQVQPFNEQTRPPQGALLWILNQVSNTDKHRMLTQVFTQMLDAGLGWGTSNGVLPLETKFPTLPKTSHVDDEIEIVSLRFAVPCSHEVVVAEGTFRWNMAISAQGIDSSESVTVPFPTIAEMIRHVDAVVDIFDAL